MTQDKITRVAKRGCPIEYNREESFAYECGFIDGASYATRWVEIKEGCEMPEADRYIVVKTERGYKAWEVSKGFRFYSDETHWQYINFEP
jgi:hypothetical protein